MEYGSNTYSSYFNSLEHGPFKGQSALNSNWLPMSKAETPEPRPGSCNAKTTEEGMNFVKRHTLVDRAVPSAHNMPLFIKTSLGERLTVIAVDSGVPGVQDSGKKTQFLLGFVYKIIIKIIAKHKLKKNAKILSK